MDQEYIVAYRGLDKDGKVTQVEDNTIYDTFEVWDSYNNPVCVCFTEEHADSIVAVLNAVPLYHGNIKEFDT